MEEQPHQHVWAYRGLEYEIGEKIEGVEHQGSWRERNYFDTYFCRHCLQEKLIPRYVAGNSTAGPPLAGSTPRGQYPKVVEPKEEEPTPIEHLEERGSMWVGESYVMRPRGS